MSIEKSRSTTNKLGNSLGSYLPALTLIGILLGCGISPSAAATAPPLMLTPGQFSVSPTGASTYTIPITVPPGTSGVAPALSLNYSSQNGDGFVGIGWGLSGLPSISRCPRTLAQDNVHGSVNYDSNDRFCMDGQRLMLISGTYGANNSQYRTEIESFSKIIAHGSSGSGPSWFEVRTKAGQIMEFGNTSDSQALVIPVVSGTPPAGTVRAWQVNKISDTVGNYMTVTYSCAPTGGSCVSGEAYPTRIDYTGNAAASVTPYNSARFEYATRSDSVPVYQAGGVVQPTVVLTHIKGYQGANLVEDYRLAYRAGTSTLRSHLTSVTQCDYIGSCLPAITFGWQGNTYTSISTTTSPVGTVGYTVVPGDWNGDGLTDFTLLSNCGTTSSYPVYLGQPSFGFSSSSYTFSNPMPSGAWPSCFGPDVSSTVLAPDATTDFIVGVVGYRLSPPGSQFYLSLITSAGPLNLSSTTGSFGTANNTLAGDYNGDGIPDFFDAQTPTSHAYLGNTSGTFSADGGVGGLNPNNNFIGGDFDGDGCTDVLSPIVSVGSPTLIYGYNCAPAQSTVSPPTVPSGYNVTTGDFNGDGKTDILLSSPSGAGQLWLSTGRGFVQVSDSLPSGSTVVSVGDWNGDGRADVLIDPSGAGTSDYALYLSTGSDFTPALDGTGTPVTISSSAGVPVVAADWDNNGNTDLLVQSSGGIFNLIDYTPELMVSVSNGVGANTIFAYDRINTGSPFYTRASSTYPTQDLFGPQYVVKEVDTSNGLGTCNPASSHINCLWVTYTYAGAQKDLKGRGFLGFSTVQAADQTTNVVTTTNYSASFPYIGLVTSSTRVHGTVTLSSITNTYTNNSGCGVTPAASGVVIDCLSQSAISGNDLSGAALPSTTTNYTYDNYGNALTVSAAVSDGSSKITTNTYLNDTTNWFLGRLLTTSVNSIVGSSNLTRNSSFSYDTSTGLLTQEVIEPGISTCNFGTDSCTLTTSYTYDLFGHRISSTVSGTGITTRTSLTSYDSLGQFPASTTNALGQREYWTYEPDFGGPSSHSDLNYLVTNWSYDSFGRVSEEIRPDGTRTDMSYAYCTVGTCPTNGQFYANSIIKSPGGTSQVGANSYVYYDMLSRGIANETQGFSGSYIRVATTYDTKGRVQQTSRPYFPSTMSPAWTNFTYDDLARVTLATFPDTSQTSYGYNGLTTSVTNNLSQTTTTVKNAQGLNYQVTDATSHTTTYIYDAFGDLTSVTDPSGNTIANTFDIRGNKTVSKDPDMGTWTYVYNVLSQLTRQTDAKSQITDITYDVLGRVLTRQVQGLNSSWSYGTDPGSHDVGQVTQASACVDMACTKPVSKKIYQYDALARQNKYTLRVWSKNYPTPYPSDFTYKTSYDTNNGKIAQVVYPSGFYVNRSYNSQGYLTQLSEAAGTFWIINSRDAELHITSQTEGNGITETQTFDPNTGLIQNQRAGSGGSVASFDYAFDTIGNLTRRTDNNQSYTERFCYDSLNRLINYYVGANCTGNSVTYDYIGNITAKSDTGNYSYGVTGPHQVSAIGGTFDGITNPNYSYDRNGNLTCVWTGSSCSSAGTVARSIGSTAFNMPQSVRQGTNSLYLNYDEQYQRVQQVNTVSGTATTTTVYMNDAASGTMSEYVSAATTTASNWNSFNWNGAPWDGNIPTSLGTFTDYITVDGQTVAQRKLQYPAASAWDTKNWSGFNWAASGSGGTVTWGYFNLDHLGSVAVISASGGGVTQRLSFDAWGKQRNPNGTAANCGTITAPTTRGFTNQEEMPTQCIVNLNARLYDTSIGKFMEADSVVPDTYDAQSYNRYAYVKNNPLSFIDPTGHYGLCNAGDSSGCGGGPFSFCGYCASSGGFSSPSDEQLKFLTNGVAGLIASSLKSIINNISANQSMQMNGRAGADGYTFTQTGSVVARPGETESATVTGRISQNSRPSAWSDPNNDYSAVVANGLQFAQIAIPWGVTPPIMAQPSQGVPHISNQQLLNLLKRGVGYRGGTATIYEDHGHVSIRITVDTGGSLQTHQTTINEAANSPTVIEETDEGLPRITLAIPDAQSALAYSAAALGQSYGPYDPKTNSCVTYCGDVLRAGGVNVPSTTNDIVRYLRKLGGGN